MCSLSAIMASLFPCSTIVRTSRSLSVRKTFGSALFEVFEPDVEMVAVGADEIEIAVEGVVLFDRRLGDAGGLVAGAPHQDAEPVVQSGLLAEIEAETLLFAKFEIARNFAPLEHADLVGGMNQNRVDPVEPVLEIIVHPVAGIVVDVTQLGRRPNVAMLRRERENRPV